MQGIRMKELLESLIKYDFYDWEHHVDTKEYVLKLGMPKSLLSNLNIDNFYDSWGIEAVNNIHANPSFNSDKWLELENEFFSWLKNASEFLFPNGKAIVTPNLEKNWILFDEMYPLWNITNQWMKFDYEKYIMELVKSKILEDSPSLRDEYRGLLTDSYSEIQVLGKMAIKGVPLLFFSQKNIVISITEYLSIVIFFRNQELLQQGKQELINLLSPQVL